MCNLYERIENLCKKNGVSVTQLCREAGVPRANLTELKMGRQQSLGAGAIAKIAEFFDVSSDYLVTGKEKAPASEETGARDDDLKFALFGGGGEITDEMFDEVKAFAQWVKARNNGK